MSDVLPPNGGGAAATLYVLVDPFHPYAKPMVESVARRLGYSPLCVHTGGRSAFRLGLRDHPWLRAAEHAFVDAGRLEAFARDLSRQRPVAGAIPLTEATLLSTLQVLIGLGSNWNEPAVIALLRDKFALKQHLREVAPGLEVGASSRWPSGAPPPRLEHLPPRFVLKPNRGYGNVSVGYFNEKMPQGSVDAFPAGCPGLDLVVEEFHPGTEYFVNGQTDGLGDTTVVAIFRYERVWANHRSVDWLTHQLPRAAPEFAILEEYAARTLSAVGLRRSPFHLEVRLTSGRPRLIELGARLAGNGNALLCERLHGGKLDLFGMAAGQYLRDATPAGGVLDWRAYDERPVTYVHGVAFERAIIYSLEGIEALERHPWFGGWVRRPAVGQRMWPTADLFSSPWCFLLQPAPGADVAAAAAELRALLRINRRPPWFRLPAVRTVDLARRILARASALLR